MNINLSSIGMEKGQKYEGIITSTNSDNSMNAAPIGILCDGEMKIKCRIFKTSKTLSNILENKEFTVNITDNPILFTFATIDNIPNDYYDENNILKDIDAFFTCKLQESEETIKHDDPVKQSEAILIRADVEKIVLKNNCAKAMNRGIHALIESLVNYTRIDIVNKEKQDYYLDRIIESERVINKVGSPKEKEAITILKDKITNKGYKF
ncbi:DUF447 family protein [Methanobrevibacter sp. OttesenSCG-928-K11]|nr:DUF447 family protein [Methanobrevibacter sp. OttesenSCG-928-K11]MDL2271172.1 DUF447 family protein [Methanobrevibacter sp. OttesenSCG-928-I08]